MLKSSMKSKSIGKSVFILLLFCFLFGIYSLSYGLENKTRIGFGTTIASRLVSSRESYVNYALGMTTFRLPVFIKSRFKIEPDLAFWTRKSSDQYSTTTNSIIRYGCAFFLTRNFEKTSLSFGPRFAINHQGSSDKSRWDDEHKTSVNDFSLGFVFGGEYFFSQHFSLGSEIQLNYWHIGNNDNLKGFKTTSLKNEALVVFRFYL